MSEAVTIELSEEVAHQAREVASRTGRRMADVLTDWLSLGASIETITPLIPGAEYPIYTLYGNEPVAQELLDELHAAEPTCHTDDSQR